MSISGSLKPAVKPEQHDFRISSRRWEEQFRPARQRRHGGVKQASHMQERENQTEAIPKQPVRARSPSALRETGAGMAYAFFQKRSGRPHADPA